jgi:hypothetical protein
MRSPNTILPVTGSDLRHRGVELAFDFLTAQLLLATGALHVEFPRAWAAEVVSAERVAGVAPRALATCATRALRIAFGRGGDFRHRGVRRVGRGRMQAEIDDAGQGGVAQRGPQQRGACESA